MATGVAFGEVKSLLLHFIIDLIQFCHNLRVVLKFLLSTKRRYLRCPDQFPHPRKTLELFRCRTLLKFPTVQKPVEEEVLFISALLQALREAFSFSEVNEKFLSSNFSCPDFFKTVARDKVVTVPLAFILVRVGIIQDGNKIDRVKVLIVLACFKLSSINITHIVQASVHKCGITLPLKFHDYPVTSIREANHIQPTGFPQ